jgi:hypothetical protein
MLKTGIVFWCYTLLLLYCWYQIDCARYVSVWCVIKYI